MPYSSSRRPSNTTPTKPAKKQRRQETDLGLPPPYRLSPVKELADLNLHQRLCVLQEWIGGLKKEGQYADGRTTYNFHAHDDVMDVIRVRLARLGIDSSTEIADSTTTIFKGRTDQETGHQKEGFRTVVVVVMTLTNADKPTDFKQYTMRMTGQGYDDKDHSKAGTLAQKYFWIWKLNLGNAEDSDSEKQDDVAADVSTTPPAAELEGIDEQQWKTLAFLAQTVGWGPKKVRARIVHHGSGHDGYVATLNELQDEHATAHGLDCAHVREMIAAVGEPAQTALKV